MFGFPEVCLKSVVLLAEVWEERACLPTPMSRHVVVHCLVACCENCFRVAQQEHFDNVEHMKLQVVIWDTRSIAW